jgi:hypothetical protein
VDAGNGPRGAPSGGSTVDAGVASGTGAAPQPAAPVGLDAGTVAPVGLDNGTTSPVTPGGVGWPTTPVVPGGVGGGTTTPTNPGDPSAGADASTF